MQKGVADYFVNNYEDYFYFALKHSSSFQDAEEVMQETFLRLYKKNEQVENPVSRIKQSIIFAAADFYREYYGTRRKHRIKLESLDGKIENFKEKVSAFELERGMPDDVEKAMATYDPEKGQNELSDNLTKALKKTRFGDLFYMHVVDEKTQMELAKECGVSNALICLRISETKKQLEEILKAA